MRKRVERFLASAGALAKGSEGAVLLAVAVFVCVVVAVVLSRPWAMW